MCVPINQQFVLVQLRYFATPTPWNRNLYNRFRRRPSCCTRFYKTVTVTNIVCLSTWRCYYIYRFIKNYMVVRSNHRQLIRVNIFCAICYRQLKRIVLCFSSNGVIFKQNFIKIGQIFQNLEWDTPVSTYLKILLFRKENTLNLKSVPHREQSLSVRMTSSL